MQMLISKPSLLRQEADAVYQRKEEVFDTPWQLSHPLKGFAGASCCRATADLLQPHS